MRPYPRALAMLAALLLPAALAAESRPAQAVLKDATRVLRVNDGRWVDRQVAQLAAACGQDPAQTRARVARAIYASSGIDGVDLQRPSLLAWREGRSPLMAVIPLRDRRAFLDAFGALPEGQPPLVRIADRDGTVVYTQNHPGRRDEYRLLISADTAYLARTPEECRQLADRPLVHAGQTGAVEFSAWPPFGDRLPLGVALPELGGVPAAPVGMDRVAAYGIETMLGALARDATEWSWSLGGDDRSAVWKAAIALPAGTPAGEWLRVQSNVPVRVVGALPPRPLAQAWFQSAWQGQCEVVGLELAGRAKAAIPGWGAELEEAWKTGFAMLDRAGGIAGSLSWDGADRPWCVAIEHPQAQLLGQQLATIDQSGAVRDDALPGWKLGARAYGGAAREATVAAYGDRVLALVGTADASAPAVAQGVVERAAAGASAELPAGIAGARFDLARWVLGTYAERLDEGVELAPAVIALDVRADAEQLAVQCRFPTQEIVQALGRVAWK